MLATPEPPIDAVRVFSDVERATTALRNLAAWLRAMPQSHLSYNGQVFVEDTRFTGDILMMVLPPLGNG